MTTNRKTCPPKKSHRKCPKARYYIISVYRFMKWVDEIRNTFSKAQKLYKSLRKQGFSVSPPVPVYA